jgi:Ran GTPase-activating protein 1
VAFLSAHTPLKHLYLNNNGLGPAAGTLIADALTTLAAKKKEKGESMIETIICGRNRLETGSMVAWAKALTAHGSDLRYLKMVQNGIRPEGITELLRNGLANTNKLQVLDLQDNTFRTEGANLLSRLVLGWTDLKELAVSDCYLTARGTIKLGEALAQGKNTNLEVIRLQFNEMGSKGLAALATATEKLPKLRRVELNGNAFSEDDEAVDTIRSKVDALRKKEGPPMDEDTEEWGLDELDELESEDEEEEDEAESDAEEDAERKVKEDEQAENQPVAQEKDKSVDQLADILGKTGI